MLAENPNADEHDKFIIDGLRVNDQTACTCLIERYLGPLISFIRKRHSFSTEDCEDIASATLLRVSEVIDTYKPSLGTFRTWIFGIAKNRAIDHYRKIQHQQKDSGQVTSFDETTESPLSEPLTSSTSLNPVLKGTFLKAFGELSEEDQTVLKLSAQGFSQAEIGEILRKSEDAVKVQAHRVRKRLKDAVERLAEQDSVNITGADWDGLKNLNGQKEAGI